MKTKFGKTTPSSFNRTLFGLCVAGLLGLVSTASAQTVVNFETPAADAYVRGGSYSENNYSGGNIEVRRTSSGDVNRKGYIRFDFNDQLNGVVTEASFSLTLQNIYSNRTTAGAVNIYGLNHTYVPGEGQLGREWEESELTNLNAPWGATSTEPPSYVTYLGALEFPGAADVDEVRGETFTLSSPALTSLLNELLQNGQSSLTLILMDDINQAQQIVFASKEHATYAGPSLSVTTVIPEPSTVALGFGGVALLLALYRKRFRRA